MTAPQVSTILQVPGTRALAWNTGTGLLLADCQGNTWILVDADSMQIFVPELNPLLHSGARPACMTRKMASETEKNGANH